MKPLHVIMLLATLAVACSTGANQETATADVQQAEGQENKIDYAAAAADSTAAPVPPPPEEEQVLNSGNAIPPAPFNRQIIRNAQVEMECADFKSFSAQLYGVVKSNGAWLDSEQETQSDYRRQNVMTIKVPVAKFDALMQAITSLKGDVREKKTNSEDVTNAIVDVQGRLEAKRQTRARYMELLKQANKMEDILQVQAQINSITEEIESATFNIKNMQAQAAVSTIHLTYYQPIETPNGYNEPGVFTRMLDALSKGGSGIVELSIVMLTLWPLWLVVGGLIFWIRKRRAATSVVKQSS